MSDAARHLDLDALQELRQIMGSEFSLLIDTFTSDSVLRIESLREAIHTADPEAIRRAAHSFKGSASNMGAVRLTDLCRTLEDMGHNGQTLGSEQLLEQIIIEYGQVKEALLSL